MIVLVMLWWDCITKRCFSYSHSLTWWLEYLKLSLHHPAAYVSVCGFVYFALKPLPNPVAIRDVIHATFTVCACFLNRKTISISRIINIYCHLSHLGELTWLREPFRRSPWIHSALFSLSMSLWISLLLSIAHTRTRARARRWTTAAYC